MSLVLVFVTKTSLCKLNDETAQSSFEFVLILRQDLCHTFLPNYECSNHRNNWVLYGDFKLAISLIQCTSQSFIPIIFNRASTFSDVDLFNLMRCSLPSA